MVYRAKITRIFSTIESYYNLKDYAIVYDNKDAYIEVGNEDEAELIEKLNKLETERIKTLQALIAKINFRKSILDPQPLG